MFDSAVSGFQHLQETSLDFKYNPSNSAVLWFLQIQLDKSSSGSQKKLHLLPLRDGIKTSSTFPMIWLGGVIYYALKVPSW